MEGEKGGKEKGRQACRQWGDFEDQPNTRAKVKWECYWTVNLSFSKENKSHMTFFPLQQ